MIKFHLHPIEKDMSNGMRMYGSEPLSDAEIKIVKKAIAEIEADEAVFVFNDPTHPRTCYNAEYDVVYVARNIFPDTSRASTHPRDLMSVRAVLAHEYYGHRTYREEYLHDMQNGTVTTSIGDDEIRASVTAAKITPNLDRIDRVQLIQDAAVRAQEFGVYLENDDFMKEVLYGYSNGDKGIVPLSLPIQGIKYISMESADREDRERYGVYYLPEMRSVSDSHNSR